MVDVQVAEADGVDVEEPGVLLQRAEGAVAEVDDEAEPVRLEEVARCGAVRPGKAPGATNHGKTHATNLSPELTLEALFGLLERAAVGPGGQVLPAAVGDEHHDVRPLS